MTNYEKYFGTPERAAGTLDLLNGIGVCLYREVHNIINCSYCDHGDGFSCDLNDAEWLESEADHD